MFGLRRSLALATLCCAAAFPLRTQHAPAPTGDRDTEPRWFAGIAPGYGQLHLLSDLGTAHEQDVFTLSFRVGRRFGARARVGAELGGWLIEPSDYNDPGEGASVSDASLFAQYRPSLRVPFFLEAGGGAVYYTNQAPDAFGAEGVGWWAGAGWQVRVRDRLRVVPGAYRSGGRFHDTRNVLIQRRGLRFDAWDLRVGLEADWR